MPVFGRKRNGRQKVRFKIRYPRGQLPSVQDLLQHSQQDGQQFQSMMSNKLTTEFEPPPNPEDDDEDDDHYATIDGNHGGVHHKVGDGEGEVPYWIYQTMQWEKERMEEDQKHPGLDPSGLSVPERYRHMNGIVGLIPDWFLRLICIPVAFFSWYGVYLGLFVRTSR